MELDDPLVTTVVGSYPARPSKSALSDSYYRSEDPYLESIEESVEAQLDAGIDLISDGQTRMDMIRLFADGLRGFRLKDRVKIVSEIGFTGPITVKDQKQVKKIANDTLLKGIITGPWTMVNGCENEHYDDKREAVEDTAEALHEEAEALAEVCDVVQVDEPFLSNEFPDFVVEAVEKVLNVNKTTAVHICGDIEPVIDKVVELDVDILDHEFAANPSLFDTYSEMDFQQRMAVGVVTTEPKVEKVSTIVERIERGMDEFGPNIMLDPDCGLRHLEERTAKKKLENLVKARNVIEDERS